MELTAYQQQFKKSLTGDFVTQFDSLVDLVTNSADVPALMKELPPDFGPMLEKVTSLDEAFNVILKSSDWGNSSYAPPKSTVPKKAVPTKKSQKPKGGTKAMGDEATAAAPTKRRGNPEALAKARAARGLKTPEEQATDRETVVNRTVEYLKAHTGENEGIQPVKPLVLALVESLKGKGSKGTDLSESFIYTTITKAAREDGCPFAAIDTDRKRGYKLA